MTGLHFRNSMVRMVYNNIQETQLHQNADHPQWYLVNTEILSDSVKDKFIQFNEDPETKEFLNNCFEKSDRLFTQIYHTLVRSILTWFISNTTVNGLLQRGSMFVFSFSQFCQLLDYDIENNKHGVLLDLGAGDGKVTEKMANHFSKVYVTEMSPTMHWRLTEKQYKLLGIEEWHKNGLQYDVISCLNLLDRCNNPRTLLANIKKSLVPDTGRLILAVVLPFCPFYEYGNCVPEEMLLVKGGKFEEQVTSVVEDILQPAGFMVEKFTRVPYLCEGDLEHPFYILHDAIFVLKVT